MKALNYMMLSVIFLILMVSLSGCTDRNNTRIIYKYDTYCNMDSAPDRAEFILQCIKNANPRSDEEPEDWITKCQYMAEKTLCPKVKIEITQRCGSSGGCIWIEQSRRPYPITQTAE